MRIWGCSIPLLLAVGISILSRLSSNSVTAACELSTVVHNKLYNYSLASSIPGFPHGVLSEDGFYKVAVNDTVLWFQLCDTMIFNHDLPRCFDCEDCGGPSRCGSGCSALVAEKEGGYPICTTLGHTSSMITTLIDNNNPQMGVTVTMSNSGEVNCSLSVSVSCDANGVQGPQTLEKSGTCNYATRLRHPLGCAKVVSLNGKASGWFITLIIIILCLFGGYLLVGAVYRYFALHIRGIDTIPNLEFWASLPHKVQSFFVSIVRKFRGPSQNYRASYSSVNF